MPFSRYLKRFQSPYDPDQFLLFSTKQCSMALVPKGVIQAIEHGESPPDAKTLHRLGMLVSDLDTEQTEMRGILDGIGARTKRYKAMVVLNLDCNLNCVYCFEGGFRERQYLTEETAALLVEEMRGRIADGVHLSLGFYGGEPLLSRQMIKRISRPLQKAAQNHPGSRFDFSLVTNGTLLTHKVIEELAPLGLNQARITLDGPPEIHDRQRPFLSGAGSFATILRNIKEAAPLTSLNLGGNFREENFREFPKMLDHLLEAGIDPNQLGEIMFAPVTPKAGVAELHNGCSSPNEPWLAEATLYLREETLRRGFKAQKARVNACMVELDNHMVVNWDGSLYKCAAFMGWEGTSIGTLKDGVKDYAASHAVGFWKNEECLCCPYLPLCFGGCRFLNLVNGWKMSQINCRRQFLDESLGKILIQELRLTLPR